VKASANSKEKESAAPSGVVRASFAANSSKEAVAGELRKHLGDDVVSGLMSRLGKGVDPRGYCFLNFVGDAAIADAAAAKNALSGNPFFSSLTFQLPTPSRKSSGTDSETDSLTAARRAVSVLELEQLILSTRVCDAARLPATVVEAVLERSETLRQLYGVSVEALSSRGIQLRGTPDALVQARRSLCALGKDEFSSALSVHRLVTERCRGVFGSTKEQARAQQCWEGRRVLLQQTGELVIVRQLRVDGPSSRIFLECVQPSSEEDADDGFVGAVEVSSDEAVAWDEFGFPDSVRMRVPDLGSDDLVAAFAQRACAPVSLIEAVEVLAPTKTATVPPSRFVRVTFDVTSDVSAPARAVAQLHGLSVGAAKFRLSVVVSPPELPIRVSVGAPRAVRLKGRHDLASIKAAFTDSESIVKVDIPAETASNAVTVVHFSSSASALAARRAPPTAFAEPGMATLDLRSTGRLECADVPLSLSPADLQQLLLPLAKSASAVRAEIGDGDDDGNSVFSEVEEVAESFRVLKCGPGTMKVVFSFPHLSLAPARIADAAPLFPAPNGVSTKRASEQWTTFALLRLVESDELRARAEEASESDSDGRETISSFASSAAPTLTPADAVKQLRELKAGFEDARSDPKALSEKLNEIILGLWPHPTPRGVCRNHTLFELGSAPQPCRGGMACHYGHSLVKCSKESCNKPTCSFVHSVQLADVLRLDTALHKLYSEGGGAPEPQLLPLLEVLKQHRAKMLREGDALITQHSRRAEEAEALFADEKAKQPANGQESAAKASSLDALHGRVLEVGKQIAEFSLARAAFLESDPDSFAASRVFAREVYNRFKTCLPIYAERATILAAVKSDFCVLVLSAETGSGKSTQVVQYLSETMHGRVICSQPRRLAADTLADRVASEMQTTKPSKDGKPQLVSCKGGGGAQRSEDRQTRIQFCTDFGLLNALYYDPTLRGVGAVVVDEVHERSVATDLLIALLRRTLSLRAAEGKHPFRLVLTSATMNEVLFARYLARANWDKKSPGDSTFAPILKVGGRTFPVAVHYETTVSTPGQHERAAEAKAIELHARLPPSNQTMRMMQDILIFQTAPDECERIAKSLSAQIPDALVVPLHGGLDKDEQRVAFEPADPARFKRKIVCATNIAEASVTIDGIGAVIDPGVSKQARYDPAKDATVLRVMPVSQASARQRAGRAGRTAPGDCYRLYSKDEFDDFDEDSIPELLRADATEAILAVLRQLERQTDWISDVRTFPFVEHPGDERLERALQQLLHLGALADASIGSCSKLTPQGSAMARMRCSPRIAAILFAAKRLDVVPHVAVALGSVPTTVSLFLRGRTDEDVSAAEAARSVLARRFPQLGDIGLGIAVWLETRDLEPIELKAWCRERSVSVRAVRECQKQTSQLFSDATDARERNAVAADPPLKAPNARDVLSSLTADDFFGDRLSKLQACLLAGYFSSLAFILPRRPGDDADAPPNYFLPHSLQIAVPGKEAACRSSIYPSLIAYMEVIDTHRVFLSNCFGVDESTFKSLLPPSYRDSAAFKRICDANAQRQAMSVLAVASTDCAAALRRLASPYSLDALKKIVRAEAGISEAAALVLEVDSYKNAIYVACADADGRERAASYLRVELAATAKKLMRRHREFAVPGTGARGVISVGSECTEILLRPQQSVCLRFNCLDISKRLSEPVVAIYLVPAGFFRSLADVVDSKAMDVSQVFGRHSKYTSAAQGYVQRIPDLQNVSVDSVVSAIEYTQGGICYPVNAFLRALNEAECKKVEPYLRALNAFHRLRSAHPLNSRRKEYVFYRGTGLPQATLEAVYKTGCTVVWPSFTSTSTNMNVATAFSGGGEMSVLFEISASAYCPLRDISVYPSEEEILFPAFSCFQVVSVGPWRGGNSRKIVLRHDPSLASAEPPPPEQEVDLGLEKDKISGSGPLVLKTISKREGLAGIAEDVTLQLCAFDADVDVDVRTDPQTKRVWGRAFFTSSAAAAKAASILNGSQLGLRELQVHAAPVDTDLLQLRCKVFAMLSAVPHTGSFICSCGVGLADEVLHQALQGAFTDKNGKTHAQLLLSLLPNEAPTKVRVEAYSAVKDGPPLPGMLRLSRVPGTVPLSTLYAQLVAIFPSLPSSAISPPARDKTACENEAESLRRLGLRGTRERTAFLAGLVGGIECAEETGISYGANFTLWFASPEAARVAAKAIDGKEMPGTGLRAQAVAESSIEVVFLSEILDVLDNDVTAIVDRLKASAAHSNSTVRIKDRLLGGSDKERSEKKHGKTRIITVSGVDGPAIASAQRELEALQRGTLIAISSPQREARMAQREKLFPSVKRDPHRAAIVAAFLRLLQDENRCLIQTLYSASALRVVGRAGAAAAVGARVATFIAEKPFEATVHFPRARLRDVRAHIDEKEKSASAEPVTAAHFKIDGSSVVLTCLDAAAFVDARTALSAFVAGLSTKSAPECCVCFEPVRKSQQTCNHAVLCPSCFAQNISIAISENRFPLCCVECNVPLLSEDVASVVDDLDGLLSASVSTFVLQHSEFGYCATPDCKQILDRSQPTATCGICQRVQCPLCGEEPHKDETCADAASRRAFLLTPEGAASVHARKMVATFLSPHCPQCGTAFLDFSACFALNCGSCRGGLCGFCLFGTGATDPHSHTADCPWYKRTYGLVSSHFGGAHGLPGGAEACFSRCMRKRLAEMAADYLLKSLDATDLRHYAARDALKLMTESEWFDEEEFKKRIGYKEP
jgi:HrpA-like RNA helicase